jgi:WD40 repeat protein
VACKAGEIRIYSVPDGKELAVRNIEPLFTWLFMGSHNFYTVTETESGVVVRKWPLDGGEPSVVGRMDLEGEGRSMWGKYAVRIDPEGTWLAYGQDRQIYLRSLENWSLSPRIVGEHRDRIAAPLHFDASGDRIGTRDVSGEIRIWSTEPVSKEPMHVLPGMAGMYGPLFDRSGTRLIDFGCPVVHATVKLWHLTAPPEAEPLVILRGEVLANGAAFDPSGRWLATANVNWVTFWPLTRDYPLVLRGHASGSGVISVAFTPDGKQVVSAAQDRTVRLWSLEGGKPSRVLLRSEDLLYPDIDIDPLGEKLLVSGHRGKVFLVPLKEGAPRALEGFSPDSVVGPLAFGPGGRLAAAAPVRGPKGEKVIRIWDLESGESRVLGPVEDAGDLFEGGFYTLDFLPDGRLLSCGDGVGLWDLEHRTMDLLEGKEEVWCDLSANGRHVLYSETYDRKNALSRLKSMDLMERHSRVLESHGNAWVVALDPTGTLAVSGGQDGVVRVGPVTGEEPRVLFGHQGSVQDVAVSPDGRWIASAGGDSTIRLWPMPDMDQPPFHTLPYDEILSRLRSVTNVRVVEDETSSTGYRLDLAPFPGWEKVPEW